MAVSVEGRPYGVILGDALVCSVGESGGFADVVTSVNHGLSTNNIVYLKSRVSEYNGFFYIEVIDANEFYIKRTRLYTSKILFIRATGPNYDGSECVYHKVASTHNWNCVHLPIAYKVYSDSWPTNVIHTPRTISALDNSNGYCRITASASTPFSAVKEYIQVTGASDPSYDGVYQLTEYTSNTQFTINLSYSSAADTALTGATIQYYYNNYYILVKVFAGIPSGHTYNEVNPVAEIATLRLKPNSDNVVTVFVNELIKTKINSLKNNLLLGTLPNNTDFWTSFYISIGETTDSPSAGSLVTYTSEFTSDASNFIGYAANAKLPFKNIHSGSLSEYVNEFLTTFETPRIFGNQYFDLSFIDPTGFGGELLVSGANGDVAYPLNNDDVGIYRIPFEVLCSGDTPIYEGQILGDQIELSLQTTAAEGDGYLSNGTGFVDDGLTTAWLIAPYEFNAKGLRSSSLAGGLLMGSSVNLFIVISSGALQNVTISCMNSSNTVIQTATLGDISAGINVANIVPLTNTIEKFQINAAANSSNVTGSITEFNITRGSVYIPNASFDSAGVWTNVNTGGETWSFSGGGDCAVAADTSPGLTNIARSGSLVPTVSAGATVTGSFTYNLSNTVQGYFRVYLWNGSTREEIYTNVSSPITGTGSDATITISSYVMVQNNNTNFEIEFYTQISSGILTLKEVTLATGMVGTSTVFNNDFSSGSTGWTQVGSGYDWTFGSGNAVLTIPSPQFGLYFLSSGDSGRTIRTGLSIPAGNYVLVYGHSGVSTDLIFEFRNNTTVVYTHTNTVSGTGSVNTGLVTFPGSVNNVRITAEGNSAGLFTITSLGLNSPIPISTTKTFNVDCGCYNQGIYMTWLNYLGGFDYWLFTAEKEYQIDILDSQTLTRDIASDWPNSYGEFADTIEQQVYRNSKESILVRSQILSLSELNAIKHVKTSPLVQIIESVYDRRTVIVDKDSFKVYDEGEKLYSIQFKVTYTNEIPSQTL